jgi:hypothetical protein
MPVQLELINGTMLLARLEELAKKQTNTYEASPCQETNSP